MKLLVHLLINIIFQLRRIVGHSRNEINESNEIKKKVFKWKDRHTRNDVSFRFRQMDIYTIKGEYRDRQECRRYDGASA